MNSLYSESSVRSSAVELGNFALNLIVLRWPCVQSQIFKAVCRRTRRGRRWFGGQSYLWKNVIWQTLQDWTETQPQTMAAIKDVGLFIILPHRIYASEFFKFYSADIRYSLQYSAFKVKVWRRHWSFIVTVFKRWWAAWGWQRTHCWIVGFWKFKMTTLVYGGWNWILRSFLESFFSVDAVHYCQVLKVNPCACCHRCEKFTQKSFVKCEFRVLQDFGLSLKSFVALAKCLANLLLSTSTCSRYVSKRQVHEFPHIDIVHSCSAKTNDRMLKKNQENKGWLIYANCVINWIKHFNRLTETERCYLEQIWRHK